MCIVQGEGAIEDMSKEDNKGVGNIESHCEDRQSNLPKTLFCSHKKRHLEGSRVAAKGGVNTDARGQSGPMNGTGRCGASWSGGGFNTYLTS